MNDQRIESLRTGALSIVEDACDGNLPYGYRLRFHDAFAAAFSPRAGHSRWSILGYIVASETLTRWTTVVVSDEERIVPQKLLDVCRQAILRTEQRHVLRERWGALHPQVDLAFHAYMDAPGCVSHSYAPYAALAACDEALKPEWPEHSAYCFEDTEYDIEPFLLDSHAFAAMDAAGPVWTPDSRDQRRTFWLHWIKHVMPMVLGTEREAFKALEASRPWKP